jgi:hypothetical protein
LLAGRPGFATRPFGAFRSWLTLWTCRTIRARQSIYARITRRPLRPGLTLRSGFALCPGFALRSGFTLRPGFTLRSSVTLRPCRSRSAFHGGYCGVNIGLGSSPKHLDRAAIGLRIPDRDHDQHSDRCDNASNKTLQKPAHQLSPFLYKDPNCIAPTKATQPLTRMNSLRQAEPFEVYARVPAIVIQTKLFLQALRGAIPIGPGLFPRGVFEVAQSKAAIPKR